VLSVEESGQLKHLENPAGRSATAALERTEIDLAKPTVNQRPLRKEKNLNPLSKPYEYPS
jgi:hypothetical protein